MTREEVQAVIDKGRYLILDIDPECTCVFKPEAISKKGLMWGINEYYKVYTERGRYADYWGMLNWREATPEEIERYTK